MSGMEFAVPAVVVTLIMFILNKLWSVDHKKKIDPEIERLSREVNVIAGILSQMVENDIQAEILSTLDDQAIIITHKIDIVGKMCKGHIDKVEKEFKNSKAVTDEMLERKILLINSETVAVIQLRLNEVLSELKNLKNK